MHEITLTQPDDWHLHLRDNEALEAVVHFTSKQFGRAIVMPNLSPPITTVQQAIAYKHRILQALPADSDFLPLMTLYLTDNTRPEEIEKAAKGNDVIGVKLYPAGATTNSEFGVTQIENVTSVLTAMEQHKLPLLVHGEVTQPDVDVFDRESRFIETVLKPIQDQFKDLKIVLEHITTRQGVDFVMQSDANVAGTLTPQHLLLNRNALFQGGIRPHNYCLPILKREEHRQALLNAAISGSKKFFLGTDSAPHGKLRKENNCGCAGMFTAHAAIELYAEAFEQANALDKLEGFASHHGADFYGLPRNKKTVTLQQIKWDVPEYYPFGQDVVVPFRANETINWKLKEK